ncbi:hypothetical protein [Streptomyces sp. NPDC003327]
MAELAGYARFRDAMERAHGTTAPVPAADSATARPERETTPAAAAATTWPSG